MSTNSLPPSFDYEAMRRHAREAGLLLKALANERRLLILCLLTRGEHSVGEINALLDLSQSALSQHLALLRRQQLVQTRREAQTIYYSLVPGPATLLMHTLYSIYCEPDDSSAQEASPPSRP